MIKKLSFTHKLTTRVSTFKFAHLPLFFMAMLSMTYGYAYQDEAYFFSHPKALQTAIEQCTQETQSSLDCSTLKKLALRLNNLADSLGQNPLQYGQQILLLQTIIVHQQQASQKNPTLTAQLARNQQELRERLAVIRWLESPES